MLRFSVASHWITATRFFLCERQCSVFCTISVFIIPLSQQVNGNAPFFRAIFSVLGDIERIYAPFFFLPISSRLSAHKWVDWTALSGYAPFSPVYWWLTKQWNFLFQERAWEKSINFANDTEDHQRTERISPELVNGNRPEYAFLTQVWYLKIIFINFGGIYWY